MQNPYLQGEMLRLEGVSAEIDPVALDVARRRSGDAREKLASYITSHHGASTAQAALKVAKGRFNCVGLIILGIAVVFGALASFTAFNQNAAPSVFGKQVNILWLFGALLGTHCLALVVWAFAIGSRIVAPSIQMPIFALLKPKGGDQLRAYEAVFQTILRGYQGRLLFSSLSHGFWFLYLSAGLLAAVLILSFDRYIFIWETTLLSPETMMSLVRALAQPIDFIGISTPNEEMILAAGQVQNIRSDPADSVIWARFCLAAIVVYGVVPRLVLFALCLVLFLRSQKRLQLTTSDPVFADILARIYQPDIRVDIVDPDLADGALLDAPGTAELSAYDFAGQDTFVMIGWEIDPPIEIDTRRIAIFDRPDALEQAVIDAQGKDVCLLVSAINTPDRGVEMALQPFKAIDGQKKAALLLETDALIIRSNQADADRRIAEWWSLLTRLGFDASAIHISRQQAAQ